jgi:hypothetical protein
VTESQHRTSEGNSLFRLLLTQYQLPVAIVGMIGTLAGLLIPRVFSWIEIQNLKAKGVTGINDTAQLQTAAKQNEMWNRNQDCFDRLTSARWFESRPIRLASIVCPKTNDILIQVKYDDHTQKQFLHWIAVEEQKGDATQSQSLGMVLPGLLAAYATSLPPIGLRGSKGNLIASEKFSVITQTRSSTTTIMRLTRSGSGNCYSEMINTFSGAISRTPKGKCPLVYIQYASNTQHAKSEALRTALNGGGFAAPGVEHVGDNIGPRPKIPAKMQIRISKNDEVYLKGINQILSSLALPKPDIVFLPSNVKAIEIWFGLSD